MCILPFQTVNRYNILPMIKEGTQPKTKMKEIFRVVCINEEPYRSLDSSNLSRTRDTNEDQHVKSKIKETSPWLAGKLSEIEVAE